MAALKRGPAGLYSQCFWIPTATLTLASCILFSSSSISFVAGARPIPNSAVNDRVSCARVHDIYEERF